MTIFSPVAIAGLYGVFYVVLPNALVHFGLTTRWSEFVDEADLFERAQYPFAAFGVAAILAGLLARRLHGSNRPTFVPSSLKYGYLLVIFALLAVGAMVVGSQLGISTTVETNNDLTGAKFLLSFADLAIPAVALILFSRLGRPRIIDFAIIAAILFAYALLGSRYRLISVFIIILIYMRWNGYTLFSLRNTLFGMFAILMISFFSIGRSYRQGFNFESLSDVTLSDALTALFNETNSQLALGAVTIHVPKFEGYVLFEPFVVAATSFIPRALWTGKPTPEYLNAIPRSLPGPLEKSGAALPIYGEWYLMGGYLAIFLVGFLLIYILQVLYLKAVRQGRIALVACLSCFTAYAYTRGYLAQNINAFVFIVAPAYSTYWLGQFKR